MKSACSNWIEMSSKGFCAFLLTGMAMVAASNAQRDKSKAVFRSHEDMYVTAMLPGLTISAEGVGDAKGQLEAGSRRRIVS
jgi:hypothetical protein